MDNHPTMCDPQRIELFLQQKLSEAEQTEFQSHLDICDDCCRHLEASAAAEDVWTGVRESLRDQPLSLDGLRSGDSDATGEDALSSQSTVLKLLAPTDDDRMLGRWGTYEVVGVVGTSGMGVVLKAFDAALNRYVAIKILAPHLGSSGAARKRFSREAQAAAAVVHDNVIEIHGVAEAAGLPYLVMPYVRGPSLQRRIDDQGPMALVEILRVGMQAAAGLAAAHAQGLVHRDVKPANILLADGIERVKLTDFGLARAADDASLTNTGVIAGTPQYMSPEQARGEAVDQRSDLFSLGSVLYEMCTGRAPFRAETSYGVLRRITDDEPRPIREINPEIPEWLCGIVAKLMAKRPEERFQSASDVAALLEQCLAHVQQPATVPLPNVLISFREMHRLREADGTSKNISRSEMSTLASTARSKHLIKGTLAMLALIGISIFAVGALSPPPDISGNWQGDEWGQVELTQTAPGEYTGTYTDTVAKEKGHGKLELKWSRIERRYNGTWREGEEDRFGDLSIHLVDHEVHGALTTSDKSKINPATPRLAEFAWTRIEVGEGNKSPGTDLASVPGTVPAVPAPVVPAPLIAPSLGKGRFFLKVYRVADLARPLPPIVTVTGKPDADWTATNEQVAIARNLNLSSLTKLITETVAPKTWDGDGGEGTIVPFGNNLSLEISQTQSVHDEIVDLLEQIRRQQQKVQVTLATAVIRSDDHGNSSTTLLPAVTLSNGQTALYAELSDKGLSSPIEIQPIVPADDLRKVKLTVGPHYELTVGPRDRHTLTADVKSGAPLWLELSSGSTIAMPAQVASPETEKNIGRRRVLLRVTPLVIADLFKSNGDEAKKVSAAVLESVPGSVGAAKVSGAVSESGTQEGTTSRVPVPSPTSRSLQQSRPAKQTLYPVTYNVGDLDGTSLTATDVPGRLSDPASGKVFHRALFDSKWLITALIVKQIAPETWEQNGGQGTIASTEGIQSIVVIQTHEVHEKIVDFLEELRRMHDVQVRLDAWFVKLDADATRRWGLTGDSITVSRRRGRELLDGLDKSDVSTERKVTVSDNEAVLFLEPPWGDGQKLHEVQARVARGRDKVRLTVKRVKSMDRAIGGEVTAVRSVPFVSEALVLGVAREEREEQMPVSVRGGDCLVVNLGHLAQQPRAAPAKPTDRNLVLVVAPTLVIQIEEEDKVGADSASQINAAHAHAGTGKVAGAVSESVPGNNSSSEGVARFDGVIPAPPFRTNPPLVSSLSRSPFERRLPSGITVELLGVSDNPSKDTSWLRPDGSPLAEPPANPLEKHDEPMFSSPLCRFFVARVENHSQEPCEVTWDVAGGAALRGPRPPSLQIAPGKTAMLRFSAYVPEESTFATVRVGTSSGPWQDLAVLKLDAAGRSIKPLKESNGVGLDQPVQAYESVFVQSHGRLPADELKLVAVRKDGRIVETEAKTEGEADARRLKAWFPKVRLDELSEIKLQRRPYSMVQFKRVFVQGKPQLPALAKKAAWPSVWKVKVIRSLQTPTSLDFVETPLKDVIDYLKEYHHIEIQLDQKVLADAKRETDTPVTLNIKGMTLQSALAHLLYQVDLEAVVMDEVLLITTRDEARRLLKADAVEAVAPRTPEVAVKAEKIERILDSPAVLEFVETPLKDVVAYLKAKHGIEILINERALGAAKISLDTPVTINVRLVSLGSALRLLLRNLGLTDVVKDEYILITVPPKNADSVPSPKPGTEKRKAKGL